GAPGDRESPAALRRGGAERRPDHGYDEGKPRDPRHFGQLDSWEKALEAIAERPRGGTGHAADLLDEDPGGRQGEPDRSRKPGHKRGHDERAKAHIDHGGNNREPQGTPRGRIEIIRRGPEDPAERHQAPSKAKGEPPCGPPAEGM